MIYDIILANLAYASLDWEEWVRFFVSVWFIVISFRFDKLIDKPAFVCKSKDKEKVREHKVTFT